MWPTPCVHKLQHKIRCLVLSKISWGANHIALYRARPDCLLVFMLELSTFRTIAPVQFERWTKRQPSSSSSTWKSTVSWWRHEMETFSALLAICVGNSPVPGEFPSQRPVTRSFDVFFDPSLNKRLSKHSRGWWFETLSGPLWRHSNDVGATDRFHSAGNCKNCA